MRNERIKHCTKNMVLTYVDIVQSVSHVNTGAVLQLIGNMLINRFYLEYISEFKNKKMAKNLKIVGRSTTRSYIILNACWKKTTSCYIPYWGLSQNIC